jgi:protein tyrosine phosphatase
MVWEQGTLVVVMTTRVNERGRTKCSQYWPTEEVTSVTHGQFTINTLAVETNPDYIVTFLNLINNKVHFTLYI